MNLSCRIVHGRRTTRDTGLYREKRKKMPCSFYESNQAGSHQDRKSALPVRSLASSHFWFPPIVLRFTDLSLRLSGPPFTEDTDAGKQDVSSENDSSSTEPHLSFFWFSDKFLILPNIPPVVTAPSSLTYSTESGSPSQYSYGFNPSDYSSPSDILTPGPMVRGIYTTHGPIQSDDFSHDLSFFGSLPPLRHSI